MDRIKKAFSEITERDVRKKKLIASIISLFLATVVLVSATFCWYAITNAEGDLSTVGLEVGNGLRVNDLSETEKEISDKSYLLPASSVDGRNLFFAGDGSFSKKTEDLTYRTANAGDRNYDYVQLDYDLTAEANYTNIYLDTKEYTNSQNVTKPRTYMYFKGWNSDAEAQANGFANKEAAIEASKSLRAAVWYEGIEKNKPIVFTSQNKIVSTQAVSEIDRSTGEFLERQKQTAYPFEEYTYGYRQIATLNQGETRRFSIIIWLEGTVETHTTSDRSDGKIDLTGKKIDFSLAFTTSWDNTEKIKFNDQTTNYAVSSYLNNPNNKGASFVLTYNNEAHKISNYEFNLYKDSSDSSNHTWYCEVPGTAYSDLTFVIKDSAGNVVYKWERDTNGIPTKNRGDSTMYVADTLNGTDSRGHWHDGEIEDHGIGYDHGRIDIDNDDDW